MMSKTTTKLFHNTRDVFVALAVVVAIAPYISWRNCLHYKTFRIYQASDSL